MYTINFERPPCGYALTHAQQGENINVVTKEFTSSEDGDLFIERLEGIPSSIINLLQDQAKIKCSDIDLMIVLIKKSGECKVCINEPSIIAMCKPKIDVNKNDPVFEDDLADISEIRFEGIDIPADEGILVLFSIGWRKGFFFDLNQVIPGSQDRDYNIYTALGHYYNYLFFQHLHKINDSTWENFFKQKWFPFIGLKQNTIKKFIGYMKSGLDCDALLEDIHKELTFKFENNIQSWNNHPAIKNHSNFISTAAERFKEGDYISCVSILYPRIEGILRGINYNINSSDHSQKKLSIAPMKASKIDPDYYSAILPNKFSEYLENVYFANFDPRKNIDISRNSVSHGVAKEEDYSEKSAIIAFLVIEQIFFHVPLQ